MTHIASDQIATASGPEQHVKHTQFQSVEIGRSSL